MDFMSYSVNSQS